MKIRTGFVSNSSSSSFLLFMDNETKKKILSLFRSVSSNRDTCIIEEEKNEIINKLKEDLLYSEEFQEKVLENKMECLFVEIDEWDEFVYDYVNEVCGEVCRVCNN